MKKKILLLLCLIYFGPSHSSELNLYVIRSPKALNWQTPRGLLLSAINNYSVLRPSKVSKYNIGHVFVGFKCQDKKEVISGMFGAPGMTFGDSLFKEQLGIGILVTDHPGALQSTEMSLEHIETYASKTDRLATLKIDITDDQCQKLEKWYQEYSDRPEMIYGGVDKRPLRGEGAGCSAYAMSFFEVADIHFNFFDRTFLKTVYLPKKLMGGGKRKVNLFKVLQDKTDLSVVSDDSFRLDFYDPTDMYHWIHSIIQDKNSLGELKDYYDLEVFHDKRNPVIHLKRL